MDMGSGEFVSISGCILLPYKPQGLTNFLRHLLTFGTTLSSTTFIDIIPEQVTYDLVWNGLPELCFDSFDFEYLNRFVLSDVDISFGTIPARLQVQFSDDLSYQINLHFNSEIVAQEKTKIHWSHNIEKIALEFFALLTPVYGCMGIERTACGV